MPPSLVAVCGTDEVAVSDLPLSNGGEGTRCDAVIDLDALGDTAIRTVTVWLTDTEFGDVFKDGVCVAGICPAWENALDYAATRK